jgi:hypothetical protein
VWVSGVEAVDPPAQGSEPLDRRIGSSPWAFAAVIRDPRPGVSTAVDACVFSCLVVPLPGARAFAGDAEWERLGLGAERQ